ncbi:MFS transporter [Blastococcus sp. Marseille-P5729]|uniref:MFS transporter n=1 Tax=Blastococcus sp. Marseille-P5729 TaxID=2086582 RepID=UPI000D0F49D4|nr:MFS transporter [Blastococcus sp. Marseille-P5729]
MSHGLRRWAAAIVTVFFAAGLGLATYLSRTPHVRDLLGASTSEMSLMVMSLGIGSMTGLLAAGHLESALGPRRAILVFGLVAQAGLIGAAFAGGAHSFVGMALGLIVFGLGAGTVDVVMNVSAAAVERQLARTVMPVFHAIFSLGTLAGAGLGALAERYGLPLIPPLLPVAAINAAAVSVTNPWICQPPLEHDAPVGVRARLGAWKDRRTLLIGVVVLGMALAEGSANDWLALTMVDGHGVSNTGGAVALGVFLASMTLTRLAGVRLVDRIGRVLALRACGALACGGLLLVIFVDNAAVAYSGVALWGAGAALGFPLGMSAAAEDPRYAAARVSVVSTIGYIAFLVAPPVIGFLGERTGLRHALLLVLVLVAAATLLSGALRERAESNR